MHELSATTSVRFLLCVSIIGAMFLIASVAHAQGNENIPPEEGSPNLSTNGIFGCRGDGAAVANVGTTRAVGGVYVPVNDAAVTLNTGYLVYKECVLDGMARNIAQNATAELTQGQLRSFNNQNNTPGGAVSNYETLIRPYKDQVLATQARVIQNSRMCGAFRGRVATALVRSQYSTRGSIASQACSMPDANQVAVTNGSAPIDWNTWLDFIEDNELTRYEEELARTNAAQARLDQDMREMIMAGRGVIPVYQTDANPLAMQVVTPGFLIADSISQSFGSGYRQLENANEIDQIVSNLFAGLTTRLVTSSTGIPGLFASVGGQPAYIDRMVSQTQAMVRSGAVSAALAVLSGARSTEAAYFAAKQGIATAVIGAVNQLRGIENQCWDLIIPAVRTHAAANGNPTLVIATSTQFSQAIIDAELRTLASTTAAEVTVAQQALTRIDQMIVQVQNSASPSAQQQVILQLEQMLQNGEIHSTQDAQNASSQRDAVTSALATLVSNTRVAWGDSTDPTIGWCNVNNTAVVERWFNEWRR